MNRKQIESNLSEAHMYNQPQKVEEIYMELINSKGKLDRWFTKYIDMFDEQMNTLPTSHPIWKLYNVKFDQYSDINQTIKTAEYYMKKA